MGNWYDYKLEDVKVSEAGFNERTDLASLNAALEADDLLNYELDNTEADIESPKNR